MRQVFELRQIGEFQEKWVDDEPTVDWEGDYHNPKHRHSDVVEENQIVDDGKEKECEESEAGEDAKAPKPWKDTVLILL